MMSNNASPTPEASLGYPRHRQTWLQKISVAWRGIKIAVRSETSFFIHLLTTVAVVSAGLILSVSRLEWCLLIMCIATVLCAEFLNTAIERIAMAITPEENENIRDALDIASGAVLFAAFCAVILGTIVFGTHALSAISS